jgi:hypothetical protein
VWAPPPRGGCAAAGWAPVRRARDRRVACAWQGAARRHERCGWWHSWSTDGSRPSVPGEHTTFEAAGESTWGRVCGAGGRSLGAGWGASRAVVALDARRSRSVQGMVREPVPGVVRPAAGVGGVAVWRVTRGVPATGVAGAGAAGRQAGWLLGVGAEGVSQSGVWCPFRPEQAAASDGQKRPLRSRFWPRLRPGVVAPRKAWRLLQGESPCRGRGSHPPVSSLASMAESGS